MKKKSLALLIIAIIFCVLIIPFFNIGNATMVGETYIYDSHTYEMIGGRYVKGNVIAKTKDGIKLYGIKGDKQLHYLVDSLSRELYMRDDLDEPHLAATGVFVDHNYYEQETLVNFTNSLYLWATENDPSAIEKNAWLNCEAVHTAEFVNLYLCYDNYQASQAFVGCISKVEDRYFFIDASQISNKPYTGKKMKFRGIKIKSHYDEILEPYF